MSMPLFIEVTSLFHSSHVDPAGEYDRREKRLFHLDHISVVFPDPRGKYPNVTTRDGGTVRGRRAFEYFSQILTSWQPRRWSSRRERAADTRRPPSSPRRR